MAITVPHHLTPGPAPGGKESVLPIPLLPLLPRKLPRAREPSSTKQMPTSPGVKVSGVQGGGRAAGGKGRSHRNNRNSRLAAAAAVKESLTVLSRTSRCNTSHHSKSLYTIISTENFKLVEGGS